MRRRGYEMTDRDYVLGRSCCVCTQFREKLEGTRNHNAAYTVGSNQKLPASSFKDHASSNIPTLTRYTSQETAVHRYPVLRVMDSVRFVQQTVNR